MLRLSRTLILVALAAPVAADTPPTKRTQAASLRLTTPTSWTQQPAPSDVRAAQFNIPGAAGAADGELILFFFGASQGGGVEDNLNRWYGQMEQPDGRSSRQVGVVTTRKVNDLRITLLDLSGTYVGMRMPRGPKEETKPDYRLLAAVVEGPGGPWFLKAVGPAPTMAAAKADFERMLDSLEHHR